MAPSPGVQPAWGSRGTLAVVGAPGPRPGGPGRGAGPRLAQNGPRVSKEPDFMQGSDR